MKVRYCLTTRAARTRCAGPLTQPTFHPVTEKNLPAEPIVSGGLRLVNGTLDLLTKRFEFQQANIDFVGDGSTDPVLDVAAQAQAEDITAVVAVTGRASSA